MNKTAIKNYAVWARNELIGRVTRKAFEYEVTSNEKLNGTLDVVNGRLLTEEEKKQRQELIRVVKEKGFDQVIEEVAYTWFNRFIALRFMEVNNYLPKRVRIFTNENNEFKPQILDEAMNLDLDGLDKAEIYELLQSNQRQDLYKKLLIATCNDMGNYLPGMFTKINDYKVLLFPDNLLNEDSVLGKLISNIDEVDFNIEKEGQVEIIGWLYQDYISEQHNKVVDPLYGKGINNEDIPAATQLFTPDWIVRYMVDNSLGRYWLERNPNNKLRDKLKYYVESDDIQSFEKKDFDPSKLTFFDPCMGSGHILVYAFDVLMDIYRECGYSDREAAIQIVENNLYGLDIDQRAYQLSYLAIMMKGRQYNRKFLLLNIQNNLAYIEETNEIQSLMHPNTEDAALLDLDRYFIHTFKNAKVIGSLCSVKKMDYKTIIDNVKNIDELGQISIETLYWSDNTKKILLNILKQADILSNQYDIVCTNPPYLNNQPKDLNEFVLNNYSDFLGDLFSVFVRRNIDFCTNEGYCAYMTPNVWMFIQSFEKMRRFLITELSITSFLQLAKGSYKEAMVDLCSFVVTKRKHIRGNYIRLKDYPSNMDSQREAFINHKQLKNDNNIFYKYNEQFLLVPNFPIAFWLPDDILETFNNKLIGDVSISKAGIVSGKDPLFLRFWFEVNSDEITLDAMDFSDSQKFKYVPINKGGNFKRWYGNNEWVINIYDIWNSDKVNKSVRRGDPEYYFKKCLTWSYVTSGIASFRFSENRVSSTASPSLYFNTDDDLYYTLALTNTFFAQEYYEAFNDTVNLNITNVSTLPYIECKEKQEIIRIVKENIEISKKLYDSSETSIGFKRNLLICSCGTLNEAMVKYKKFHHSLNEKLHSNEIKLNTVLLNVYQLDREYNATDYNEPYDEMIVKSFISYAVGCMFGRYSLDEDGLAYAGGEFNSNKYKSFAVDSDNIIPICDDEYFDDDIVGRFTKFVETVYGSETLGENLKFIADALGGNGMPKDVIRNYFLNEFYKDHCKTYQKRPIYWLFDSGKKNGFKALIYMHRYSSDLIARLRTKYVFEQQSRYRNQIEMIQNQLDGDLSSSERVRMNKSLKTLREQDEELRKYEEVVHHYADQMISIDLDDGVKVNYEKFNDLLAKIK